MITNDQWDIAAAAYQAAKNADSRMPNADEAVIDSWAGTLFARVDYPPLHVKAAVESFYRTWNGDELLTAPRLARECSKLTADRIERLTTDERAQLDYERDKRLGLDTSWYSQAPKLDRNLTEVLALMPWARRDPMTQRDTPQQPALPTSRRTPPDPERMAEARAELDARRA